MSVSALPSVQFTVIAPAGFAILGALERASRVYTNLVITSGTDGAHSGPDDPHHLGCAYDVRSHDFDSDTKLVILNAVMGTLGVSIDVKDMAVTTDKFFGWLEQAGTNNEHFHFQLRHGQQYP